MRTNSVYHNSFSSEIILHFTSIEIFRNRTLQYGMEKNFQMVDRSFKKSKNLKYNDYSHLENKGL